MKSVIDVSNTEGMTSTLKGMTSTSSNTEGMTSTLEGMTSTSKGETARGKMTIDISSYTYAGYFTITKSTFKSPDTTKNMLYIKKSNNLFAIIILISALTVLIIILVVGLILCKKYRCICAIRQHGYQLNLKPSDIIELEETSH
jgi:hypothetical protein